MTHDEALKTIESLHDNYCAEAIEDLVKYVLQQKACEKIKIEE